MTEMSPVEPELLDSNCTSVGSNEQNLGLSFCMSNLSDNLHYILSVLVLNRLEILKQTNKT